MNAVGISAAARYLPWFRLTAEEIARTQRRPAPRRAVERRLAGYDEDALTMAVAAARLLPAEALDGVERLLFATTTPPYLVKNNASAAHAALGLAETVPAFDAGSALRSSFGAILGAADGSLLLTGDVNTARPGAATELSHGDAGVALLFGPAEDSIAELVDSASVTDEVLDHWRLPSEATLQASEDRFPVSRLLPAVDRALAKLSIDTVEHVIVSAPSSRVAAAAGQRAGALGPVSSVAGIGFAGSADLPLQLCNVLALAQPGDRILALSVADGCDALVLRCTQRLAVRRPSAARQSGDGVAATYLDALAWRGLVHREPPRRPEPAPVSPAVAARRTEWKYALHGSRCGSCGAVATPPQRVCLRCRSTDTTERVDLSRLSATIRTYSVDRLAYSPNPPMIAAIVDFDGGGRLEVELTDTAGALAVGNRVQMTFRLRHSSGGIHNYAWKAIPEGTRHG